MEQIRFILVFMIFFSSCSMTNNKVDPDKPELDFLNNNYLSPAVVFKYKINVDCSTTPYWEGQKLKLQGFVYSGNINTVDKGFFLYEKPNIGESPNEILGIGYLSKDSAVITKVLLANKDKNCLLKVTCSSSFKYLSSGCSKGIEFTITKPEDLEFK